eukprot:TRINITY_DN10721_c0_g1_i4.p2 TRINITY_DN10721_c0_g1~~TRINITY_DN10721_c0_g1_i4.p2  ORF type:complete len:584 (+),score=136.55 TRINITY_DN10721_c0_g1_i4:2795-4546(+)
MIHVQAHHGKDSLQFQMQPTATLDDLKREMMRLTGVQQAYQKLIGKKITPTTPHDASVAWLSTNNKLKFMMVVSDPSVVEQMKEEEARAARRLAQQAQTRRMMMAEVDKEASRIETEEFAFLRYEILQEFEGQDVPSPAQALTLLRKLGQDPAIRTIMKKYKWSVGLLKEFKPSMETGLVGVTQGCLLGYNQNKGEVIALRLRTDDFEGFRHYHIIIRTLLHELAHMVHSDHDANFHALNRLLNKEYDQLSHGRTAGSTAASGDYEWQDQGLASSEHVLGGEGTSSTATSAADARARAANAALARQMTPITTAAQADPQASSSDSALLPLPPAQASMQDSQSLTETPLREERLTEAELRGPLHDEDAKRARIYAAARQAEMDALGDEPFVYRPRRSVKIGKEYQAVIPDLEPKPSRTKPKQSSARTERDTEPARAIGAPAKVDGDDTTSQSEADAQQAARQTSEPKAEAMDLASDRTPLQQAWADLLACMPDEMQRQSACKLLTTILTNLISNPTEFKYQRINMQSSAMKKRFASQDQMAAVTALLNKTGFAPSGDGVHVVYKESTLELPAQLVDTIQEHAEL